LNDEESTLELLENTQLLELTLEGDLTEKPENKVNLPLLEFALLTEDYFRGPEL
jgi:hypothetical protein